MLPRLDRLTPRDLVVVAIVVAAVLLIVAGAALSEATAPGCPAPQAAPPRMFTLPTADGVSITINAEAVTHIVLDERPAAARLTVTLTSGSTITQHPTPHISLEDLREARRRIIEKMEQRP